MDSDGSVEHREMGKRGGVLSHVIGGCFSDGEQGGVFEMDISSLSTTSFRSAELRSLWQLIGLRNTHHLERFLVAHFTPS